MIKFKHYVAGWLDSSIHDFLVALPPKSHSVKYALITCLDSNENPGTLLEKSPELRPIAEKAQVLGRGLLLSTKTLIEADLLHRLFFAGFDEVWFFPTREIEPIPEWECSGWTGEN